MDNDDFKKQLDELFRLYNKLIEKYPTDDLSTFDKMQLEQMRVFLRNYETMKNHLSFEPFDQVNEPMRQMISMFIKRLREELGETEPHVPVKNEAVISVDEIDSYLRNPNLSEEQINHLLDERARLAKKQNS